MKRFIIPSIVSLLALSALEIKADTTYPLPGWKEKPNPVASVRAVKGGVIRINGSQPPQSLNAYIDSSLYTSMLFELCYETLLGIDPETSEFTPNLACRWSISDDAQTYTFEIDPRAKWSDGRPVTAEDVKWTFDTVMDPKSLTGVFKSMLGNFSSVEVLPSNNPKEPPRKVIFKTSHGEKHWSDLLNAGIFPIMPKHFFQGRDFNALDLVNAVVSGPYRLVSNEMQTLTVYKRRSDWWQENRISTKGTMNFDEIRVRRFADEQNAFEAFKKGEIDVYAVYTARIWSKELEGKAFDLNHIVARAVVNDAPVGFQGFAMNMRRPPFNDILTREAMCRLLDRPTLNRTLMNSFYFLHKSYAEKLYDKNHPCTNAVLNFDPDKAAELLERAGWKKNPSTGILEKDGKPFKFTFLTRDASAEKFLVPFRSQLKKLGIEMNIERRDFAAWLKAADEHNFDMTWASWASSIFKDDETMWSSKEARRHGGNNITGLESDEIDALIQKAKCEFLLPERKEIQRRTDALIAAQIPYVLLWNTDSRRRLWWNRLGMPERPLGFTGDETVILTYWWVDPDASAELEYARKHDLPLP